MAIEIDQRPKIQLPAWASILFMACLIGFLALLLSYIIFLQYGSGLSKSIQEKNEALAKTSEQVALESDVLSKQKKINSISNLLSLHRQPDAFFSYLEKATHPQVSFTDFNLDSQKNTIEIKGKADNFVALGQQILIFKKETNLKKISLSEVSIGKDGGFVFSLLLSVDPKMFK